MILQDANLAQDAVQETYLKANHAMHRLRENSSEKAWLWRIAVNVCRDLHKSAWNRHTDRRVEIENLPLTVSPPDETHIALTDALLTLPPKEREAVLLHQ